MSFMAGVMSSVSVAEFQRACENHERLKTISEADKQLIERLIGTSHGHGRATFRHETAYLLPPGEIRFPQCESGIE